jgi:hypothetical protein
MDETASRLRAAIAALGRTKRNTPVPSLLRAEVMAYVAEQRRQGVHWASLAKAVGLSASGLKRWSDGTAPREAATPRLRRVRVCAERAAAPASGGRLALVMREGHRLEGLSREDAVAIVRALTVGA